MIIAIAGYLSGLATLIAYVPYIRDIFSGKTKPERASWFIWAVLGSILFFSQLAEGASYSLIMTAAIAVGDLFIFILAIKYGFGGFLKKDIAALIVAFIGLFLWYATKDAAFALFIAILVDASASILTIIKSYEKPTTETTVTWLLGFIGGLFACVAVGSFNFILLAFPIYIVLINLAIVASIKLGFKRIASQPVS